MLAKDADREGTFSESLIELSVLAGVQQKTLISSLERLAGLGSLGFERGVYGQPWRTIIQPTVIAKCDRSA